MRTLRRWWMQTLGALGLGRTESDLAEEMEAHLALDAEERMRRGVERDEAWRQARVASGGVAQAQEAWRDQRSFVWVEEARQDLRYAWRGCLRRPGLTLVAVLSLALGIGANATVFTWFRAVYLDPLPGVPEASQLVTINASNREGSGYSNRFDDYEFIRQQDRLLESMLGHEMEQYALGDGRATEMSMGGIVTGNFFDVLGVKMASGRGFRADEDEVPDRNAVMVISHALWQKRFGGDPGILGRRLTLNRVSFEVIGVAPPGFIGVYGGIQQDYWIPLRMHRALAQREHTAQPLQILARPKAGVTLGEIQSELSVLSLHIRAAHRKDDSYYLARVFPLHQAQRGFHSSLFQVVKVLGVAVALILLLACLNIASLLVARAMERSREMSVRLSLGAGRGRLVRQLLNECFLLALLGALAAGVLAEWLRRLVSVGLSFGEVRLVLNQPVDWLTFVFLFAIALAATLLFGILPALESTRVNMTDSLKEGSGSVTAGRRRAGLRGALVTAEVALSTAAVVGALQMGDHLRRLSNVERGFRTEKIVTGAADLKAAGIEGERGRQFHRAMVEQLQGLPEVEMAAWTTFLPMSGSGGGNRRSVVVSGYATADGKPLGVVTDYVTPGFFATLGIPVVEGRDFAWSDDGKGAPVAMVNQAFANEYLKGRSAVGATLRTGTVTRTIVGVYRDYVYRRPFMPQRPAMMIPLTEQLRSSAIAVVRGRRDAGAAAMALRETMRRYDRGLALTALMTMDENVASAFFDTRLVTWVLALFSALALGLAGMGLYGVLAAFVNQRQREMGIRTALGATPGELRGLVTRQSGRLTLVGLTLGLGLGYGLGQLLTGSFSGMQPPSLLLFGLGAVGMGLLATVAAAVPARRVSRLDAMTALRYE